MLTGLNSQQLKAVTHNAGSVLVLAGAGSGKTKVLTTRISWLVHHHNIDISKFLAVTFTTKAAQEMMHRVSKNLATNLANNPRNMWIGTFHSTALRILTQHTKAAELKSTFQVLDAHDQLNIVKRIIKQENLTEDYPAKEIVNFINHNKELCLRAKHLEATNLRHQLHIDLYSKYEAFCNQHHLLDFAELLLRSYELLSTNNEVLHGYHNQFQHIMVDEFQDTNQLQYKLIKLLSGKSTNVFVVGDDDQSIYSFRGARALNMQDFIRDFNITEPIRLEQNYRSTPMILSAANAIIDNNTKRLGKKLWTDNIAGDKLQLYEGYTEDDEAYFVADEIKQLLSRGIAISQIAILYRSNAQSRVFEQLFYIHKINYTVYGGLRFFDRQEIKHVIAYLKLLINEHDDTALLRVINVPLRGIGPRTITQMQQFATTHKTSLWTALASIVTGKCSAATAKFAKLILDMQQYMQQHSQQNTIGEIIQYIIDTTGLEQMYKNDQISGSERLANLNELVNAVTNFATTNESPNVIADFLSYAALESIENNSQQIDSTVQLMTVHAAKGLEFDVVFIVGLEDGLFPHENSFNNPHDIEEERRLMYVAVTRARSKVYLLRVYSRMMWGKRCSAPLSRFINEIPVALINNISSIATNMDASNQNISPIVFNPETKISRVTIGDTNDIVKIGDTVSHAKFGTGKIISLNIDGNKKTGTIFFIGIGQKVLDLSIAKLEKTQQ